MVEPNQLSKPWDFEIGETIRFHPEVGDDPLSDFLVRDEFTVVGFVDSPMFISYDRGASPVGDGSVRCFIMVPWEDFDMDVYTNVYLKASSLEGLSAYSATYKNEVSRLTKEFEDLGRIRSDLRYDEIMDEANGEIAEGKDKIADAEKEKDEKLTKAQEDIDDGKVKIADAEKEKDEKLAQAQKDIDAARVKIKNSEADLASAKSKFATDITKAEKDLEQGKKDYADAKAEYDAQSAQYEEAKDLPKKMETLQDEIFALTHSIYERSARVPSDDPELIKMKEELDAKKKEYSKAQMTLSRQAGMTQTGSSEGAEEQLAKTKEELEQKKTELDESEKTLAEEKKEAQDKINSAQIQIADAKEKLRQGELDYENGKKEAENKIAKAKADIAQGEQDFADGKTEAEQKIADAQSDIEQAERDLAEAGETRVVREHARGQSGLFGL